VRVAIDDMVGQHRGVGSYKIRNEHELFSSLFRRSKLFF
jgi:hypothetical protein